MMGRRGSAFAQVAGGGRLLLVGTQTAATSKGIYAYSFEAATGELKERGLAAEADNPTFLTLAPNGKTVLVANELDDCRGAEQWRRINLHSRLGDGEIDEGQ